MSVSYDRKKRHISLINYLKSMNLVFARIGIPAEFYNSLNIFVEICAVQGLHVPKLFTFIFGIGYELFLNFYNRGDMRTIPEMLTVTKYMREMFDEVLQYQGREWFMESGSYMKIKELCEKHTINEKDLFSFIDKNRAVLLGGKFLITPAKVEAIIEYYLQRDI